MPEGRGTHSPQEASAPLLCLLPNRSSHQDDLQPLTLKLLVGYTLQTSLTMWVPPLPSSLYLLPPRGPKVLEPPLDSVFRPLRLPFKATGKLL